jgi:hypothetical protein
MQLVERVIADGDFTEESLARELVVPPRELARYRAGKFVMPLDRQLCLALLLIERVPKSARLGHRLRAQVIAAMDYEAGTTRTHDAPPLRTGSLSAACGRKGAS